MSGIVDVQRINLHPQISEDPNDFQGSPHAVIQVPLQFPSNLDLNRSQSAPADVQKAHYEAAKLMAALNKMKTVSQDWKPTTSLSILKSDNKEEDAVLAVVKRIRDELYKKYPHLRGIDQSKGERLDDQNALPNVLTTRH